MTTVPYDVVVVGSGPSAVHSAWPLAEAGLRIIMLDVGHKDEHYAPLTIGKSFTECRLKDPEQHRYFLGDNFEGVQFSPLRVGAQLTPPRQYITRDTDQLAPVVSDTFSPLQSFALGGLAAAWGAQTMPFAETELADWPIGRRDLQPHYETVAHRIGMCGAHDDLAPFHGPLKALFPPAQLDANAEVIHALYRQQRNALNRSGFYMGSSWLAVATREHRGRGPLRYHDMEFWSDHDRSVYRPSYTLDELQRFPAFSYRAGLLVQCFEENSSRKIVTVSCLNLKTGQREQIMARRLILAAGTLGTARIVLTSLKHFDEPVRLLCNPYTYIPCLNVRRFGQPVCDHRHSLAQLDAIYDPDGTGKHVVVMHFYSYRSLLLFRLVRESFLAYRESIRLAQLLQDYFVIVGVHHEDRHAENKFVTLRRGSDGIPNRIEVTYRQEKSLEIHQRKQERRILSYLLRLGCLPLRIIRTKHGASVHYGGTFPMTREGSRLTTCPTGQLRAAPLIYLADGSTLPHLPAKGLTFTLMANANRIGEHVRDVLLKGES